MKRKAEENEEKNVKKIKIELENEVTKENKEIIKRKTKAEEWNELLINAIKMREKNLNEGKLPNNNGKMIKNNKNNSVNNNNNNNNNNEIDNLNLNNKNDNLNNNEEENKEEEMKYRGKGSIIGGVNGLFLIENFITEDEEKFLIDQITNENNFSDQFDQWNNELKRRTKQYGYKYNYSNRNTCPQKLGELPRWLLFIIDRFKEFDLLFDPQQLIINGFYFIYLIYFYLINFIFVYINYSNFLNNFFILFYN